MDALIICLPLLIGWCLDLILGDPLWLPHPIVWFGKLISIFERTLNKGSHRKAKGALCALILISLTYAITFFLMKIIVNQYLNITVQAIIIFYCLSGTTLIKEVRNVFIALDNGLSEGQKQVGRIVGRDTSSLSKHEVQTAALETLSENLSDGVVAPLFWYVILGVPGMMAYKMINTLDSMIGYRNQRYIDFGCVAARIDDMANYLPARITSILMIICCARFGLYRFIKEYGCKHLSPNSGYPEAALAGILDCRFGGPHNYFGQTVYKPYIGSTVRDLSTTDMAIATSINRRVECMSIILALISRLTLCAVFTW